MQPGRRCATLGGMARRGVSAMRRRRGLPTDGLGRDEATGQEAGRTTMSQVALMPPPGVADGRLAEDSERDLRHVGRVAEWVSAPRAPTNGFCLPAQPTPLIDRDAERATVAQLLARDDVRLVTL